jgi:hypothetical protein
VRYIVCIIELLLSTSLAAPIAGPQPEAATATRHRVIVSTDIGGTDPDDLQSMLHFLVYADLRHGTPDDPSR